MSLYRGYLVLNSVDPFGLLVKVNDETPTGGTPHDDELDVEEELLKLCDRCHEKTCPSFNGCSPNTCRGEAKRIAKALEATFSRNGRIFLQRVCRFSADKVVNVNRALTCIPFLDRDFDVEDDQRVRGYYCYEWAHGFEQAIDVYTKNSKCFSTTVEEAGVKNSDLMHAWVKISSSCSDQSVYYDDGFMGGFAGRCHRTMPCTGPGGYEYQGPCTLNEGEDLNIPKPYYEPFKMWCPGTAPAAIPTM
jgi:hypothetical protein